MDEQANDLLEILLRDCAAAHPRPWYPADYVNQTGVPRARLDADLDRLRLGGLLRLTEWVQVKGQGYAVTPAGAEVLQDPRRLQRLRQAGVEPEPVQPPLRPVAQRSATWDRGEAIRNSMLQSGPPVVTFLVIATNVLAFLTIYLAGQQKPEIAGKVEEVAAHMGPLTRAAVISGNEWWRLLGYAFLHAGLVHLVMNMVSLWFLGRFVEAMFGSIRYLVLYLVSSLGGACAVVINASGASREIPTVGASGGVCGLLAAAGVWVFLNRAHLPPAFLARFSRAFTTSVIMVVFISLIPTISGMCHLGGAVAGGVVAVPLVYNRFGLGWQRWLGLVGTAAVPALCVGIVFQSVTPQDRIRRVIARVQHSAIPAFNDHVRPIFNNKGAIDEEALKAALRPAAETLAELHQAEASLKQMDAPDAKELLETARHYVDAWIRTFECFSKVLDRGGTWTNQDIAEFWRDRDATEVLWGKLKTPLAP